MLVPTVSCSNWKGLIANRLARISEHQWFNDFKKYENEFEALNIHCDNENVLKTIESDVIENIYKNSRILYWEKDFNVRYNDCIKNEYLRRRSISVGKCID